MFDRSGVLPRYLKVYRLSSENKYKRLTVKRSIDLKEQGDNPIFIRLTLEDETLAWSSPIYIYR
jgi:hypothetical protein